MRAVSLLSSVVPEVYLLQLSQNCSDVVGQRENVSQRKHLAPATAAPARAADTRALGWCRTLLGEVRKDRSILPAQSRENIRGFSGKIRSRAPLLGLPGAAGQGYTCTLSCCGHHTYGLGAAAQGYTCTPRMDGWGKSQTAHGVKG